MQIYAYDELGEEIAAHRARVKENYYCKDCHQPLRVRSGPFIRTHFFHFKPNKKCFQSGKSATHIEIQSKLVALFPDGEAKEEVHFKEISRISDVFWKKEKIVFEVQVSFISAKEVEERIKAYNSLGLEVVWILHRGQFDRFKVSAAERFLARSTHYYSNHNEAGLGQFYDRFGYFLNGIKEASLFRRPIDLTSPIRDITIPKVLPPAVECRKTWGLSFKGDILSSTNFSKKDLERAYEIEAFLISKPRRHSFKTRIFNFFSFLFRFIGYLILDCA